LRPGSAGVRSAHAVGVETSRHRGGLTFALLLAGAVGPHGSLRNVRAATSAAIRASTESPQRRSTGAGPPGVAPERRPGHDPDRGRHLSARARLEAGPPERDPAGRGSFRGRHGERSCAAGRTSTALKRRR
jgi:hypothetical protein